MRDRLVVVFDLLPQVIVDDHVLSTLSKVHDAIGNCRNLTTHQPGLALERWGREAKTVLSRLMPSEEIERLVTTPTYWYAVTHLGLQGVANSEFDDASRRWSNELDELAAFRRAWTPAHHVVLDTCILLEHPQQFDEVDWTTFVGLRLERPIRIVLTATVLDEVNRIKDRGQRDGVRTRARHTLNRLQQLFDDTEAFTHRPLANASAASVSVSVLPDPAGHYRRVEIADNEVIRRACALRALTDQPTMLVTYDIAMSFRARGAGLPCSLHPHPGKPDGRGQAQAGIEQADTRPSPGAKAS